MAASALDLTAALTQLRAGPLGQRPALGNGYRLSFCTGMFWDIPSSMSQLFGPVSRDVGYKIGYRLEIAFFEHAGIMVTAREGFPHFGGRSGELV